MKASTSTIFRLYLNIRCHRSFDKILFHVEAPQLHISMNQSQVIPHYMNSGYHQKGVSSLNISLPRHKSKKIIN